MLKWEIKGTRNEAEDGPFGVVRFIEGRVRLQASATWLRLALWLLMPPIRALAALLLVLSFPLLIFGLIVSPLIAPIFYGIWYVVRWGRDGWQIMRGRNIDETARVDIDAAWADFFNGEDDMKLPWNQSPHASSRDHRCHQGCKYGESEVANVQPVS